MWRLKKAKILRIVLGGICEKIQIQKELNQEISESHSEPSLSEQTRFQFYF